jgi:hypothetical protein
MHGWDVASTSEERLAVKTNEGSIDRVIRVVLGVVLIGVGVFVVKGTVGIVLDVIGVIVLVTGILGFCLLYKVFGDFSTAKKA